MTNLELAHKLRDAVEATDLATVKELFSPDIESIEPAFTPFPHTRGTAELDKKWELFTGAIKEMHSKSVSKEVIVQGDIIVLGMSIDYTDQNDERMQQNELVIYRAKDGMIISEQFFY